MTPVYKGIVTNGKLLVNDPQGFNAYVSSLEGKEITVTIKRFRKKRTSGQIDELSNQNGYLWAIVYPISADYLGYSVPEAHELFTQLYAPYVYKEIGGDKVAVKIRTSEMDIHQFAQYVDSIINKMAEFSVYIPPSDKIA
jgi:hypothetical protein